MKIITISREYGSGGHSIGRAVAEKLGIEIYDKDIIRAVANASGIDPETVARDEERITGAESFVRKISPVSYQYKDALFEFERQVIIDLAKKGPCVILGRCADFILKEAEIETLDVFLTAHDAFRAKRTAELLGTDNPNVIAREMKRTDRDRRAYYEWLTSQKWADVQNYDLVLNTGVLGYEKCVSLICEAARD